MEQPTDDSSGASEPRPDPPEGTASERPGRERTSMDRDPPLTEDDLLRREEERAAAEAGEIGGPAPEPEGDEAWRPVEEGGGGEAEGFEQAERELGETAAHGESRWSPAGNEPEPEVESDRAGSIYSEPDEVDPTEVTSDPGEGPDDPGEGPGIAPER
jgi:hypothetical protein